MNLTPPTIQAYELRDRPGLDALTRTERPLPEPGPGQVRLRMRAASLNYRDLLVAKRTYAGPGTLCAPIIPLSDGVGVVTALGAGVERVRVGQRVASAFMPGWTEGGFTPEKAASALGGGTTDGVLAEAVVLPAAGLVEVPAHLSDAEAATLPCAGVTAWYALFVGGQLPPGGSVLLLGTGGVSLWALRLARAVGARVILTSGSEEKLARARRELGVEETINHRTDPEWDARVLALTGGRGVDLVIEVGGPGTLNRSLRAVRFGGTVSLMGVLTGLEAPVSTSDILHKNVRVQGTYVGSRAMFEDLNRLVTRHGIHPVVDRVFPFAEARAAYAYLESGQHFGKVAISF